MDKSASVLRHGLVMTGNSSERGERWITTKLQSLFGACSQHAYDLGPMARHWRFLT